MCTNGGNIVPVNVSDDVRAIWQEFNYFQFVSTDAACFARVSVGDGKKHGLTRETG
jgi:hypothetical protein